LRQSHWRLAPILFFEAGYFLIVLYIVLVHLDGRLMARVQGLLVIGFQVLYRCVYVPCSRFLQDVCMVSMLHIASYRLYRGIYTFLSVAYWLL